MTPGAAEYAALYRGDYMRARWLDRAAGIARMIRPEWSVLEIGAGRGDLGETMRTLGWRWDGCDMCQAGPSVRLASLPNVSAVYQCRFDCTVTIDVLEHLAPDDIPAALRDLSRLAPRGVWAVANMEDRHLVDGKLVNLHATQKPPEWWVSQIQFAGGNATVQIINVHRFWLEVAWPQ